MSRPARWSPPRPAADNWPARAGFAAAVLALVPLVGWGAGWPALAAVVSGWPPVPPAAAVGVIAAGVALAGQHAASARSIQRVGALTAAATLIVVAAVALARQRARLPALELSDAVAGWHASPELIARALPSTPAAAALLFLGLALVGLAVGRPMGLRLAYAAAAGAALVAILSAGASPLPRGMAATRFTTPPPDRLIPPALAILVLLLASGILLRRGEEGWWWLPTRGAASAVARVLLPTILVIPPATVWVVELMERRRVIGPEEAAVLLPALLVLTLGAAAAEAVARAQRSETRDRDRGARRLRRHALREAEQVAAQAEATLRVASDQMRNHLRTILDVAPAPFLAVDRDGQVSYANAAAAELLGRTLEGVVGRDVADAWPELGAELRAALADSAGAPVERTLTHHRTGRAIELRGFPGHDGAAVFLREL